MIMPTSSLPIAAPPISPDVSAIRAAVRRFVAARRVDAATADDLTQEVLIKVHQRIGQVRDPRRLMGWVIQIARNTVADFFRKSRPTEEFDDNHSIGVSTLPDSVEQEEGQLREDLGRYIRSVVHGLPPLYRDALVLTEYDGLTQVELAQKQGISISAAKSRVQRARALVRETIERCCHFDVDSYGTVVDYHPRGKRCGCRDESPPETSD